MQTMTFPHTHTSLTFCSSADLRVESRKCASDALGLWCDWASSSRKSSSEVWHGAAEVFVAHTHSKLWRRFGLFVGFPYLYSRADYHWKINFNVSTLKYAVLRWSALRFFMSAIQQWHLPDSAWTRPPVPAPRPSPFDICPQGWNKWQKNGFVKGNTWNSIYVLQNMICSFTQNLSPRPIVIRVLIFACTLCSHLHTRTMNWLTCHAEMRCFSPLSASGEIGSAQAKGLKWTSSQALQIWTVSSWRKLCKI